MRTHRTTRACGPRIACRHRRGVAIVYGVIIIGALLAITSLAFDYGKAQLVKTELQSCADGAARAAASGIPTSLAVARQRARDLAALNKADGAAVTFADADFVFGQWIPGTQTLNTSATGADVDAVEVTARRTVPLFFAAMFGKDSVDVAARAVGRAPKAGMAGFIGLDGIEFKNTVYSGSYTSSVMTNPTPATSTGLGSIGSNALVDFKNNAHIHGDIVLGPTGTEDHKNVLTVTGSIVKQSTPHAAPPSPSWNPGVNPNGVPQNYTINSATTLPGGTYWFTNLNINKPLTFSGPVTIYVNGNIRTDDSIYTYQQLPSNLKIYQIGNNRKFDIQKDMVLIAEVHAPTSDLIGNNKMWLFGQGIYKTILAKNTAELFFDQDAMLASRPVTMVR